MTVVDILYFSGYKPQACLSPLCSCMLCACCVLWAGGTREQLTSATVCQAFPCAPCQAIWDGSQEPREAGTVMTTLQGRKQTLRLEALSKVTGPRRTVPVRLQSGAHTTSKSPAQH